MSHPKEKGLYDNLIAFGNEQIRLHQEEQDHQLINEVGMMQSARTPNELVDDELKIIDKILEREMNSIQDVVKRREDLLLSERRLIELTKRGEYK